MEGFDVLFGFLIALLIGSVCAYALSHQFVLPEQVLHNLRQANELRRLRHVHRDRDARPQPLDDRRWRLAEEQIFRLIREAEATDRPALRAPGGEPRGEVPPLYLFAEMDLATFAAATVHGIDRPDHRWRTPRPDRTDDGIIVRILANAAFLNGIECSRTAQGWVIDALPPDYVDRDWTLANHQRVLGGGGLVTGQLR